jgi:anti-anti-sigma factor
MKARAAGCRVLPPGLKCRLGAYLRKLERPMDLEVADVENGITKVTLSGRLDVEGALKIDGEFNAIAERKKKVLVDLSAVTFIASLGIRTLITGAKATANNGGKMVLLDPQPNVDKVLRTSRVDTVIPITRDSTSIDSVFGI